MIASATMGATPARIHLINPNYPEIAGQRSYASLAEVPEPVDMAVLGVANARLEAALADAIKHGVRAATIFASCYLENDSEPKLVARLSAMAKEAGIAICGGNCMGFYNLEYGLRICGFPPPDWMRSGGIAFITHSGSAFSALCHNDKRLGINLAVSAGQELATNVADYLDYALTRDSTKGDRVVPRDRARSGRLHARVGNRAGEEHPRRGAEGRPHRRERRARGQPFRCRCRQSRGL